MSTPRPLGRATAHKIEDTPNADLLEILDDEGLLDPPDGSLRSIFDIDADPDDLLEQSTPQFKIGHTKIGDTVETQTDLLKIRTSSADTYVKEIRDYETTYSLAVELNHAAILTASEAYDVDVNDEVDFRLARRRLGDSTIFPSIKFDEPEQADEYSRFVNKHFSNILADQGADGHKLIDGEIKLADDASDQKFTEILHKAVKLANLDYGMNHGADHDHMVVAMADTFIGYTGIPFHRIERDGNTHFIFNNDIGEFCFYTDDETDEVSMVHWRYPKDLARNESIVFQGSVTKDDLEQHFISWIGAAAHERGLISEEDYNLIQSGECLSSLSGILNEKVAPEAPAKESNDSNNEHVAIIIPSAEDRRNLKL